MFKRSLLQAKKFSRSKMIVNFALWSKCSILLIHITKLQIWHYDIVGSSGGTNVVKRKPSWVLLRQNLLKISVKDLVGNILITPVLAMLDDMKMKSTYKILRSLEILAIKSDWKFCFVIKMFYFTYTHYKTLNLTLCYCR